MFRPYVTQRLDAAKRPDLTFATSAVNHLEAYREAAALFEKRRHVRVSVDLARSAHRTGSAVSRAACIAPARA